MTGAKSATVRIRRRASVAGFAWPWRVLLDGGEVERLGVGEQCEIHVAPGPHRIEVRMGRRVGSEPLDFALAAGDVVEFDCRDQSLERGLVRGLFNRGSNLKIELKPPA